MSIMGARRLIMQGVRPGDLVQVTMSLGLTNAGMMVREYLWKYTGAIALTTGSGAATPTRRQIELAQSWKTTVMLGIPSYIRHLGIVARDEMNIDPRSLGIRLICCGLGPEPRDALEELWGAKVMQQYGTNESGMMSAECPFQHGFHIFEDAYLLGNRGPRRRTTGAARRERQHAHHLPLQICRARHSFRLQRRVGVLHRRLPVRRHP